jgi:REP element-mobilizing transposase RayT
MTEPNQYLPGTTYLVTRRTERQVLLFRPDALMNQIFLFCVAWAAQLTGVQVHAFILLSNHEHLVVTDVEGRMGEFNERLNWLLTKCTQALRGWRGRVFDGSGPLCTELTTPGAVVRSIGYVLTNAVRHGLVRRASEWPGARSSLAALGGAALRLERPPVFFKEGGDVPTTVELRLPMPEVLVEAYGQEDALRSVAADVERRESEVRADMRASGRAYLGARRVLQTSPFARPETEDEEASIRPRWAGSREAVRRGRERRARFLTRYAECRERWCRGERDVIWPAGTYQMRRLHGVRCASPSD